MRKKILIVALFLLAALILSGCTGATAWPGLSAVNNVAYLAHTNVVYAVDVKTGAKLWSFTGDKSGFLNSNPSLFVTTPVVTEDGLVILLDSGNKHLMYAVDSNDVDQENKTPNVKWRFSKVGGHWVAAPLIVGNRLFAPNSDGKVYVLDLTDGKSEKDAIQAIPLSKSEGQTDRLWAQPVTDGKRLFVTSLDHRIFAIDLETYQVLWDEQLSAAIPGAPVLGSDGMLYVGSLAKQLERFDPATGKHDAVLDTNGWIWGTPIVDGDNLYFSTVVNVGSSSEGYLYSYNARDGRLNWDPIQLDGAITASPLILGDRLIIATESGDIYRVGKDGAVDTWYHPEGKGKAYTTPVIAGDYVLVAYLESDYYLIALDSDGDVKWTFAGK
jgi:outer membrane protein assembly factor BamB